MCTGSSCDVDGNCESGFTCAEPGTLAEVFSFGLATGSCVPTCAVCPEGEPRWSCSGNACLYDDTPVVDAGGPYAAIVGEPVRLSGTAEPAPDREIAAARWSSWQQGLLGEGLEIDAVFTTPGSHTLALDVEDDEHAVGSASTMVLVCSAAGGPCGDESDCCGPGELTCLFEADPYDGRCGAPPVCGDGVVEGGEACDLGSPPALDCTDLGQYHPGPVPCGDTCQPDPSSCRYCGMTFDDCFGDGDCCAGFVCEYGSCHSA
jgi:hypothetical protein